MYIHLMNLVTHTGLFWHFIDNLNLQFKIFWNILEQRFPVKHGCFQ